MLNALVIIWTYLYSKYTFFEFLQNYVFKGSSNSSSFKIFSMHCIFYCQLHYLKRNLKTQNKFAEKCYLVKWWWSLNVVWISFLRSFKFIIDFSCTVYLNWPSLKKILCIFKENFTFRFLTLQEIEYWIIWNQSQQTMIMHLNIVCWTHNYYWKGTKNWYQLWI